MNEGSEKKPYGLKRAIGAECFIALAVFFLFFGILSNKMGLVNMLNTMMNTAFDLLLNTVFYIMAVAVLAGAVGSVLSEFGIVALINKILSPIMKPIYGLPGAASVGVVTTYLSDNPAILALAHDRRFSRYFKQYQLPALTNIGTAFGMGAIITTFMMGIASPTGESFVAAALIGNLGAVIGSIVSTRIMLVFTKKEYGTEKMCQIEDDGSDDGINDVSDNYRVVRPGNVGMRLISALMDGGKNGIQMGFDIIPGVLIICTVVMMLTNGPSASGAYTGAAYEGIGFFPWVGEKLSVVLSPLFGFTDASGIAVPITALGAAGAAIGLIPNMVSAGLAGAQDIAVFTAMCMCWSGYLSTHVAMMDSLKCSKLTGKAIISHTIGGLCAGVAAHWIYFLISLI